MSGKDRILVVEDDALVSEVIEVALEDDYQITIVENAHDALTVIRDGGIRLMLLDCTLPGGIDPMLIPEAERVGAAIILMSGDPGRVQKLTDKPLPFVLKPFTLSSLASAVESIIGVA